MLFAVESERCIGSSSLYREVNLRSARIGIDGEALRKPLSGVGQYVWQLCVALEQELPAATFFVYGRLPAERLALPSARWVVRREGRALLRKLPSFAWLRTRGARLCREDRLDAFWAGRTLHPGLPREVRTVCTVHDLNHLIVPATMEAPTLWSYRLWFERDLVSATRVVANSDGTASRLLSMLGVHADAVIKPGLGSHFRPVSAADTDAACEQLRELGVSAPYFLSVATLEPRKNVEAAVRAFVYLRERGELAGYSLVLVGASGWSNSRLRVLLEQARGHGVVTLGYVPDASMPVLYALARGLLLPSLYEGFGMPALEARACGTATIVTDIPELRESSGPSAVLVEPTVPSIADGILMLAGTYGDTAPERPGPEFSWRRGARKLADQLLR